MTCYNISTHCNTSCIAAEKALKILDLQVAATKGHSLKESTKKNLMCHLRAYEKYCDQYKVDYLPCDNTQLCRFGQHLSLTFESPDAVVNYQSGIRTCLALMGLQVQVKMFTTRLKRTFGTCSQTGRTHNT